MSQLRKATRQKAKIRLGLSSVAGGGKTYSAILIAQGLTGDLSKVAIIDTENGSADLYSHMGSFNVLPLLPPYTPERYIAAIKECEVAGMECIIVDSITHEWDGAGGCLDIVEELTQKDPKHNSYTQWRFVTPRHQAFVDAMLQSSAHIITTVRRKQDYDMSNQNGKTVVTKAGLKEITRDGFEYELTVNLELDQLHNASSSKDRTGLFADKPSFTPSIKTGEMIRQWCEVGVEPMGVKTSIHNTTNAVDAETELIIKDQFSKQLSDAIAGLESCSTENELKMYKKTLAPDVIKHPDFVKAGKVRYETIMAAVVQ